MVLVNGIEKGNANKKEKEKGIETHGNEILPMPPVEAIPLNSFLIITKTTLSVSPFWPACRLHNNRRLK